MPSLPRVFVSGPHKDDIEVSIGGRRPRLFLAGPDPHRGALPQARRARHFPRADGLFARPPARRCSPSWTPVGRNLSSTASPAVRSSSPAARRTGWKRFSAARSSTLKTERWSEMYLHIGRNQMLAERRIIGIFDLEITSQSKTTRAFLDRAQQEGTVLEVCDDLPKSFLVCDHPYHPPRSSISPNFRAKHCKKNGGIDMKTPIALSMLLSPFSLPPRRTVGAAPRARRSTLRRSQALCFCAC